MCCIPKALVITMPLSSSACRTYVFLSEPSWLLLTPVIQLTASDIRSLPQSSSLVRRMRAAPSSLYVPQSYSERQSSSISQRLAAICNTQVVEIDLSASSSQFEAPLARNPVFEITIPSVGRKVDDRDYQLFQKGELNCLYGSLALDLFFSL